MFAAYVCLAGLAASPSPAACQQDETVQTVVVRARFARSHGDLDWFEGSWDALVAEAKESERLIFVDFWTTWCGYCKKLDATTFRDAAVVKEMRDVLCYSVDAENEAFASVVERFKPTGYPTLVFAESDGTIRDFLMGYLAPREFIAEVRRIKKNERTIGSLRARIEKDPADVEARWDLALKFQRFGDAAGYRAQVAAIKKYDPEGTSVPSRRLALEELRRKASETIDPAPLYAFVETEAEPSILFEAWYALWQLESYLEKRAETKTEQKEHRRARFAAARTLWPYVPKGSEHYVKLGNQIAWSYYEERAHLSDEDLAWALDVARSAAEAAPDEAYVIDTYACCLFAVGRVEEARRQIYRAIQLEPANRTWKERLHEFSR